MSHTPAEHVKMIQSPADWPRWPVLPLVRRPLPMDGRPSEGIIFAVKDHMTTVYYGNIVKLKGATIKEAMESCDGHHVYPDAEAIVDDGWIVD